MKARFAGNERFVNRSASLARLLSVTWVALGVACGPTPEEIDFAEPVETAEAPIIGANPTCSFPEIGLLHDANLPGVRCTADLVAPDMIVTAAHCVSYGVDEGGLPTRYSFVVNASPGCDQADQWFSVIRYYSFVRSQSDNDSTKYVDDVAVAQLAVPVPTAVASPMGIRAGSLPPAGKTVKEVGHGARNLDDCAAYRTDLQKGLISFVIDGTISGNRRKVTSPYSGTLCRYDSGGPVFVGNKRNIFWVNSAFQLIPPFYAYSWYGEVWRLATSIEDKMAHWSCPDGAWWDSTLVTKDQRYPYAHVCGMDRQNYECAPYNPSWQARGGQCGDTACRCTGGAAYGGVTIPSERTTCGYTVCGMDRQIYECVWSDSSATHGKWDARGTPCGPGT